MSAEFPAVREHHGRLEWIEEDGEKTPVDIAPEVTSGLHRPRGSCGWLRTVVIVLGALAWVSLFASCAHPMPPRKLSRTPRFRGGWEAVMCKSGRSEQ